LAHPTRPTQEAAFGWNRALGFFVSLPSLGGNGSYDVLQENYDQGRPMLGAELFLLEHGFVPEGDLHEAHDESTPWGLHAAGVIEAFKAAAD
jgi:hypothetical protein